jgi:hypothetical protein
MLTSRGLQRKNLSSTGTAILTSRLADREVRSETWNLSINSIFALGLTKIKENLDQSQKLCYDRRSVGQAILMSSTHLGLQN